jgi:large subunit ribosomal protein L18
MGAMNAKKQARLKRRKRIRKNISGTEQRPRLSVFRSSKHIYAQVIDDTTGRTIAAASSLEKNTTDKKDDVGNAIDRAKSVGKRVGERAKKEGINQIVFDRSGFLYHGRVKAVSEGAREAGLDF